MPELDKVNTSRVAFNDRLFKASKGAVQAAVVALNVAASATQNVPYLGAISKVLVEVSKIIDEVTVCKATWNTVMARVQEIQTVVENFRAQCNHEWRLEDELPEMIKQGFRDFEMCLSNVIVTMNDCKTTSKLQLLYKRSGLTAAANQCHEEVVSALNIFQAKLQIDQWNLQRDQGKVIHDIRDALMPHIPLVKLNSTITFQFTSNSSPLLLPSSSVVLGKSISLWTLSSIMGLLM
ncbi:TPR-like protein [Mycena venus]|uniref:TPR-like protein n=1 Tax=Mycena venus TaxID=2733690 RepID=A0A8H6XJB7_9AGAR|nr:TPR-like protein [Mycena venus]